MLLHSSLINSVKPCLKKIKEKKKEKKLYLSLISWRILCSSQLSLMHLVVF